MFKMKSKFLLPLLALLICALLCGCAARVDLGGEKLDAASETVSAVIGEGECAKLDEFAQLKSVDLSGSVCYAEILAWADAHPDVAVRYTVTLPDGAVVDNSALRLDLSAFDAAAARETLPLLAWLPALTDVDLGSARGGLSAEDIAAFVSAYPDIAFAFDFTLLGQGCSLDTTALDLSGIGHGDAGELLSWLSSMTRLESVELGDESGGLTWDDIAAFEAACPTAAFEYDFTLWGKAVSLSDEALDLNHITMDDEGALVLQAAKCMQKLAYLDMDFCAVSDEGMAAIRDALPDCEVVWRIWFGTGYSVRTDVDTILASNPGRGGELTGENTVSLKYCTKVKYLDLGHNSYLDDISFLSYMPDLEVIIIAMANWNDASPLADCPKLEYAEIQTSALNDLRPLSGLKNLRHLNLGYCFALHDISPLYELDLERLWIGCYTPIPAEQVAIMQEKHPDCVINTSTVDPTAEGWRYTGRSQWGVMELDPRYLLLRNQLRYGESPTSYAYYSNDPLYYPHG